MTGEPLIRFRCQALRRSGTTDMRIVQAGSAEAARERLIAAGLEPVSIEQIGPSLVAAISTRLSKGRMHCNVSPRQPLLNRHFTVPKNFDLRHMLTMTLTMLVAISLTLMVASWSLVWITDWQTSRLLSVQAAPIARYEARVAIDRARDAARPAMTAPSLTETLGRLAMILPPDSGLAEARRYSTGERQIEIDTPDPDSIRPILAADPLFASLREIGQAPTTEATMRVILTDRNR